MILDGLIEIADTTVNFVTCSFIMSDLNIRSHHFLNVIIFPNGRASNKVKINKYHSTYMATSP